MSELMQAFVLLAHFHSLASFIYGCGVNAEIDHPGGHIFMGTSPRAFIGGGDQALAANDSAASAVISAAAASERPTNGHRVLHADKVCQICLGIVSNY